MIKETGGHTEKYHKYEIPFEEFWNIIKDKKQIWKSLSFSRMFSPNTLMTIQISADHIDNVGKALQLTGRIQSVFDKKDIVEITTLESDEEE